MFQGAAGVAALAAAECLTSHHSGSQKSSGTLGEGGANTLESDPPATPAQAATSCSETPAAFTPPVNEQALDQAREHLAKFVGADNLRGAWVVGFTIVQWVGLLLGGVWWFHQPAALATWWGLGVSAFWLFLRVGTYVRPFITMHDAMHGTFFTKRWLNNLAGHMLGALVFIDATDFQRTHHQHHVMTGIEEETWRDTDLTVLWTTKEWEAWPPGLSKAAARVMCDPLFFFTLLGPVWSTMFNACWRHRNTLMTPRQNALYVATKVMLFPCPIFATFWVTGMTLSNLAMEFLAMQGAWSFAMWYFHTQHVFEGVYRVPKSQYNRTAAALLGSAVMPIPWFWRWVTVGSEYHQMHHANAKIPCHRMKECDDTAPPGLWEAVGIRRLTARDGFRSMLLSLWDPDQRTYVPFPEWAWLERWLAQKPPVSGRQQDVARGKKAV